MNDRARVNVLAGMLDSLIMAFERHRTTTHTTKPTFCETCRESDDALAQARAVIGERRP